MDSHDLCWHFLRFYHSNGLQCAKPQQPHSHCRSHQGDRHTCPQECAKAEWDLTLRTLRHNQVGYADKQGEVARGGSIRRSAPSVPRPAARRWGGGAVERSSLRGLFSPSEMRRYVRPKRTTAMRKRKASKGTATSRAAHLPWWAPVAGCCVGHPTRIEAGIPGPAGSG